MRVAIHQPQYIPWLSYLRKIAASDLFIILDSVAFQKNGLQNRNRIKTAQGPLWLTVPVKQKLGSPLKDVEIDNTTDWRRKHWSTLRQSYGKAPCFQLYAPGFERVYSREWTRLADLNIELLELLLKCFGIATRLARSSAMKAEGAASRIVLNLCLEAGATEYISGEGAKDYLDEKVFAEAGVALVYKPAVLPSPYPQLHAQAGFLGDLSCLDILFNCGPDWIRYVPAEALSEK